MLPLLYLASVFAAIICTVVSLLLDWSTAGLFVSFGLLASPASIILVLNPLWSAIWPALPFLVYGVIGLLVFVFLSNLTALCWTRRKGTLLALAAAALSLAFAAQLGVLILWGSLTLLPPGLWGGRWGTGAYLFLSASLLTFLVSWSCIAPAPSPMATLLPAAAPSPLPVATRVVPGAKGAELELQPAWRHQTNMGGGAAT